MPTPPKHSITNNNPNFLWGFGSKERIGGGYEYSFNGKETDNEIKGVGNSLDFGARIYDSRTGRWLSLDPLAAKYPNISPNVFVANMPIRAVDPDGKVVIFVNGYYGFPTKACCGGTKAHWNEEWVDQVKEQIGDYNARYYDGSVDDRGYGGFMGRNNFNPNFRYKMGYKQGMIDAADIINNLEQGETIKFVTSSMGTAFARGMSQAIIDYVNNYNAEVDAYNAKLEKNEDGTYKDHSQVREHLNIKIEFVVDLDSFQVNQADPNAENNYYMKGEGAESLFLSTKDIKGAKKIGTMEGHHPSWAPPYKFPKSSGNGSGSSDIENPSKNQ